MLFKLVTFLVLLSSTLFAQTNFSAIHTKILTVTKNTITVPANQEVALGATGVIMHAFDESHKTIISAVTVIKKDANKLVLSLSPFKGISQQILPSYKIQPKVGDEVILNFLYTRAMAIVPDEATYNLVTKSYNAFDWVHPDIFASQLAAAYTPTPTKETIQTMCREQNIGIVLFAIDTKGYFTDCQSLRVLNSIPLPKAKHQKNPFYSRIEGIKGRLFGMIGGKGITDFDSFYSKLLGEK